MTFSRTLARHSLRGRKARPTGRACCNSSSSGGRSERIKQTRLSGGRSCLPPVSGPQRRSQHPEDVGGRERDSRSTYQALPGSDGQGCGARCSSPRARPPDARGWRTSQTIYPSSRLMLFSGAGLSEIDQRGTPPARPVGSRRCVGHGCGGLANPLFSSAVPASRLFETNGAVHNAHDLQRVPSMGREY
jgi:hypothetical protein